jgi:chromosome partitioning protein
LPVVAVVNRKGGSGKSTLATHLAAYLARRGTPVMLGDVDRQQSTQPWLRRRAAHALPGVPIVGWAVDPRNVLRPPAGVAHIVLDTPGGMHGFDLSRLLMHADAVLMPVGDSAFDREAAAACLADLRAHPRVISGRVRVAAVGVRIDARTRAAQSLGEWAAKHELAFLGVLRAAQAYVRCADRGLTVFDLPESAAQPDRDKWQPVLEWLAPVVDAPAPVPALRPPRLVTAATARPAPRLATHRDGAPARPPGAPATLVRPAVERGPWAGLRRLLGWLAPQPRPQRDPL